jgi:hypothetical protein
VSLSMLLIQAQVNICIVTRIIFGTIAHRREP